MNTLKPILLAVVLLSCYQSNAQTKTGNTFIVAFNPLHITDDNIGFAFSYERFLNEQKNISLYLPLSFALPSNRNEDDYYYNDYVYPTSYNRTTNMDVTKGMVYFYPGVKVYLNNNNKSNARYAIGGSAVIGVGRQDHVTTIYTFDTISNGTQYPTYQARLLNETTDQLTRIKLGMMITNSLNLKPAKHFYLGIEIGLGYTYVNQVNSRNVNRDMLAQVGLKLGYCN